MKPKKVATTVHLSESAHAALKLLAEQDARSCSGFLEKQIQDLAKQRGLWTPPKLRSVQG